MEKQKALNILGILGIIILLVFVGINFFSSNYFREKMANLHYENGLEYYNGGHYEMAEEEFKEAIEWDSFFYMAHEKRVDSLYKLGRNKEAEEINKLLPTILGISLNPQIKGGEPLFSFKNLPMFVALGLIFMLIVAKFFGYPISFSNIPFLLGIAAFTEFLAVISLNDPSSPSTKIIYLIHSVILILIFKKFFGLKLANAFILTIGYNFLVEVIPILISFYYPLL